jgi:hypothetical protein
MRYRLRTLMIVLAIGPMAIAAGCWLSKTDDDVTYAAAVIVIALITGLWLGTRLLAYWP